MKTIFNIIYKDLIDILEEKNTMFLDYAASCKFLVSRPLGNNGDAKFDKTVSIKRKLYDQVYINYIKGTENTPLDVLQFDISTMYSSLEEPKRLDIYFILDNIFNNDRQYLFCNIYYLIFELAHMLYGNPMPEFASRKFVDFMPLIIGTKIVKEIYPNINIAQMFDLIDNSIRIPIKLTDYDYANRKDITGTKEEITIILTARKIEEAIKTIMNNSLEEIIDKQLYLAF